MRRKKKLIPGKTYWSLYEFRLRGVFLIDIVSNGSCQRSDIELGRIIKAPTQMVKNMIQAASEANEILIQETEEGREIKYKSVQQL